LEEGKYIGGRDLIVFGHFSKNGLYFLVIVLKVLVDHFHIIDVKSNKILKVKDSGKMVISIPKRILLMIENIFIL
jgi:hypothetical protein